MQLVLLDLWGLSSENILQKVAYWREYEIKENASLKKKKRQNTVHHILIALKKYFIDIEVLYCIIKDYSFRWYWHLC